MSQSELIADKIEEAIGRMFHAFSEYTPKVSEYAMYYDPEKDKTWFIELYFSDKESLSTALENGICYQVHEYLYSDLGAIAELKNSIWNIHFTSGNYPANNQEYQTRHKTLIEKRKKLIQTKPEKARKQCHSCGHDFDSHQLRGFKDEETGLMTKGWIICPEEDCHCFLTWSANPNSD